MDAKYRCLCATCFVLEIGCRGILEQKPCVCAQVCWGCHVCLRHRVTNCASVFDVFCSRNGLWRNSRTKALRMCRSLLGFSRLFTTSGNKCENEHGVVRCSCLYATWGIIFASTRMLQMSMSVWDVFCSRNQLWQISRTFSVSTRRLQMSMSVCDVLCSSYARFLEHILCWRVCFRGRCLCGTRML